MPGFIKPISFQNFLHPIKTRIAPTPSGFLHAGNIFSFVITAGLARDLGAKVLLRIDDLDQDRVREPYLNNIFETLRLLEIDWTEGPADTDDFMANWTQISRLDYYHQTLEALKNAGLVFACNCSRKHVGETNNGIYPGTCLNKKIDFDRDDVCWRWKPSITEQVYLQDYAKGTICHSFIESQQHFVIRKKDGMPAYHLASVLDDNFYKVNLIVRGADLYESTLLQLHLAKSMGLTSLEKSIFFHHPIITDASGQKLSKSAGALSIRSMQVKFKDNNKIFEQLSTQLQLTRKINNWFDLYLGYKEKNSHLFS